MIAALSARFAIALLLLSCRGELRLDVPVDDSIGSLIVALDYGNDEPELHAIDVPEDTFAIEYDGRSRIEVTALGYLDKSCAHMIRTGQLSRGAGPSPIPLTTPAKMWTTTVHRSAERWRPIEVVPSWAMRFERDVDPKTCIECGCVFVALGVCACDGLAEVPRSPEVPTPPSAPSVPDGVAVPGLCAIDSAQHYGDVACTRVGSDCPTGSWPTEVPDGTPRYVDPTATPGGDGSLARPFMRISDALEVRSPNDVIVLSKGVHPVEVVVFEETRVVGACVAETVLTAEERASSVEARNAEISNLRIVGSTLLVHADATATITDVVVEDGLTGFTAGVRADVHASGLVVRRAATAASIGSQATVTIVGLAMEAGHGISVEPGAKLDVTDGVVSGAADTSIQLQPGAGATLERVAIAGADFIGLSLEAGAQVSGNDVAILGSQGDAIRMERGARLSLEGLVVADTAGDGLRQLEDTDLIALSRARFDRTQSVALNLQHRGSVTLTDLSIQGANDGIVLGSGTATISRAALLDIHNDAIEGIDSNVQISDIRASGGGLNFHGAALVGSRIEVDGGSSFGLIAADGEVELTDIGINDSGAEDESARRTVVLDNLTSASVDRMALANNRAGMRVNGIPRIEILNLTIRETPGIALEIERSAGQLGTLTLEGHTSGLVTHDDVAVTVDGLLVRDAHEAAVDCSGTMAIRSFLIDGSTGYGFRIQGNGRLDLDRGEVARTRIGCGYPAGYDLRRVLDHVFYHDNDVDLGEL